MSTLLIVRFRISGRMASFVRGGEHLSMAFVLPDLHILSIGFVFCQRCLRMRRVPPAYSVTTLKLRFLSLSPTWIFLSILLRGALMYVLGFSVYMLRLVLIC